VIDGDDFGRCRLELCLKSESAGLSLEPAILDGLIAAVDWRTALNRTPTMYQHI
jgi:hypothetical protein